MTNKVRITYYGMEGQGATVKEARLDAGRQIEAVLSGYHFPSAYTKTVGPNTFTIFIYRELARWGYSFVRHGSGDGRVMVGGANETNEEEANYRALRHIAGNVAAFDVTGGGWINPQDRDGLREHRWNAQWQLRYKAWASVGLTDNECHNAASNGKWPDGYTPTY
jgi:hypothetical protein